MAHTAIDPESEYFPEREVTPEELDLYVDQLAAWVQEADGNVYVYTGAGISTSAGIPDFRGPDGVWTHKALGTKRKGRTTTTATMIPTPAHMAVSKLIEDGVVRYLTSSNCDGCHLKSGVPADSISELHGNSYIEYCIECGTKYPRDFPCYRVKRGRSHYTGRQCVQPGCGGDLWDSTIDFGQNLPEEPLRKAYEVAESSDLCIVFGSSLMVTPSCDMPKITKKSGGRLVICNLQKTPLSGMADMHIYAKCDDVAEALMAKLGVEIPQWRLRRTVHLSASAASVRGRDDGTALNFSVRATEQGLPATVFRAVGVRAISEAEFGGSRDDPRVLSEEPHDFLLGCQPGRETDLVVGLQFMGHYEEPTLRLRHVIPASTTAHTRTLRLEYDPWTRTWAVDNQDGIDEDDVAGTSAAGAVAADDDDYEAAAAEVSLDFARTVANVDGDGAETQPPLVMWAASAPVIDPATGSAAAVIFGGALPSGYDNKAAKLSLMRLVRDGDADADVAVVDAAPLLGSRGRRPDRKTAAVLGRWNQTATAVGDAAVLLIGGWDNRSQYNDVHLYDLAQGGTLTKVATTGDGPAHGGGHSSTLIGNRVFCFGGCACEGGPYVFRDTLAVLNLDDMAWERPRTTGASPSARAQHAAVAIGSDLYIFGGTDGANSLSDAFVLNTETMAWTAINAAHSDLIPTVSTIMPNFRVADVRAQAVVVDDAAGLVLVAGLGVAKGAFVFDTAASSWSKPAWGPHADFYSLATHTMTPVADRTWLVAGGNDANRKRNAHVYVLRAGGD